MLSTLLSRISTARLSGSPLTRIDLTPAELRELEADLAPPGPLLSPLTLAMRAEDWPRVVPSGARLVLAGVPVYCEAP